LLIPFRENILYTYYDVNRKLETILAASSAAPRPDSGRVGCFGSDFHRCLLLTVLFRFSDVSSFQIRFGFHRLAPMMFCLLSSGSRLSQDEETALYLVPGGAVRRE
jgi:hypothetical protein